MATAFVVIPLTPSSRVVAHSSSEDNSDHFTQEFLTAPQKEHAVTVSRCRVPGLVARAGRIVDPVAETSIRGGGFGVA